LAYRVSLSNHVAPGSVIRRPSSVSRARFGAIDLKLCTYVTLGEITVQAEFRSDLILGLATRGPKLKTQSAITPELMAGSSPNIYHRYI
jgi:hypothetical protein